MDMLTVAGVVVFIGIAVALYTTRRASTPLARLVLSALMLMVLGATVIQYEVRRNLREGVWHPNAIRWQRTPIGIYWDRQDFAPYNETIENAVTTWNRRAGCVVVAPLSSRDGADIVLRSFDGTKCGQEQLMVEIKESPDVPAWGYYCSDYADFQFKRLDDIRVAFRIFLHEIGHGIGLDHDDRGAMAPTVFASTSHDVPEWWLPSEADVAAISKRYCSN